MILVGDQATQFADQVLPHAGHDIEIVWYEDAEGIKADVAIECRTCGMVLVDADFTIEDVLHD